jgi:hypothetical protein
VSRNSKLLPPSLAQHFDAPEEYTGYFGWICGYSADAYFLAAAAERFTRLTHTQRADQGSIALAVFLDPSNPRVSLSAVPGVAHFGIKYSLDNHLDKPFRLLHAKVALLGFRHQGDPKQWKLRLLVSTGNWTRQTLEESLDLVWRVDISSGSLSKPANNGVGRDCADIKAAGDLMTWVQGFFDTDLLLGCDDGSRRSAASLSSSKVREWIDACSEKKQGESRLFDNREKSLLEQLPSKIKSCHDVKVTYLAMGSGFYETSEPSNKLVPIKIVESLKSEGLLTKKPALDLYVNPCACQSIAKALPILKENGITVRPAALLEDMFGSGSNRSLHAKFLFGAKRGGKNARTKSWVYLGSGNLTNPGFAEKMSSSQGNFEAGVVFATDSLYCNWYKESKGELMAQTPVLTDLLPIQFENEIDENSEKLKEGEGKELKPAVYFAPPVACLLWYEGGATCELRLRLRTDSLGNEIEIEVLNSAGVACKKTETGFSWCEEQPREVTIRWKLNDKFVDSEIPVVDKNGRIAATKLQPIDIDEAWWQLATFPMPPDDDGQEDGMERTLNENGCQNTIRAGAEISGYPIRQMMELIEKIAAKQTEIDEEDWGLWCDRFKQTLELAVDSGPVKYFRDVLKLNPLSPLRDPSFRPNFAESGDSASGKRYEESLSQIESIWNVNKLHPLSGGVS